MALRILKPSMGLQGALRENSFTIGRLHGSSLTLSQAKAFEDFQPRIFELITKRSDLIVAASQAQGTFAGAMTALDDFIGTFENTLRIVTMNETTTALYTSYFRIPPSALVRRSQQDRIDTCRLWIESIQSSRFPAIAALGPTASAVVSTASSTKEAHEAALRALSDFDMIGELPKFFDAYNTLRKGAYGTLGQIPHQHPEAMLPASFADQFFIHEVRKAEGARTVDDIQADIKAAQDQIAALEAEKNDLLAAEKDLSDTEAEAKQVDTDLQKAQDVSNENQKTIKTLRAKKKTMAKETKKAKQAAKKPTKAKKRVKAPAATLP